MELSKIYIEDLGGRTPVLTHCRKLLSEGVPEDEKVWFYRKDRKGVQVKVNNLGLVAKLTVLERSRLGPRFVLYRGYED